MGRASNQFLAGLDVIDIGGGIAGRAASAALARFGVTARRVGASLEDREGHGALLALLEGPLPPLAEGDVESIVGKLPVPHIVIADRVSAPVAGLPVDPAEYLQRVLELNRCVWVTISAYGLESNHPGRYGSDLVLAAAGGVMHAVRDAADGRPIVIPGAQSLLSAGQAAALAACGGLDRFLSDGWPVHLDLSALDATIATGPVLQLAHGLLGCSGQGGARRLGAPNGWYRCSDGLIRIQALEQHQWRGLAGAIGQPVWAGEFDDPSQRIEDGDRLDQLLGSWTMTTTKLECEQRLQAHGVPATAMNDLADLRSSPQFEIRGRWQQALVRGQDVTVIGDPYVTATAAGEANRHPRPPSAPAVGLRGLRVLEAGHVLAVPLAASLLGTMGASVTKLEDEGRLDFYRRSGPFIDQHRDVDWSGYFSLANFSKRSFLLTDSTQIAALLADADVIIENWGAKRASQLQIDAATVIRHHPEMLAIDSSGYGHSGPLSRYRVYAYNLTAHCGLSGLMKNAEGDPPEFDLGWADLVSGYYLATLIAAWAVGRALHPEEWSGTALDFSMAEYMLQRINEEFVLLDLRAAGVTGEQQVGPIEVVARTNDGTSYLALTVAGHDEWRALSGALGEPDELTTGALSSHEGRLADPAGVVAALEALLAKEDADELETRLVAAGVRAARVRAAEELVGDPDLAARVLFAPVEHPMWGRRRVIGLPWRVVGEPPATLAAAPVLGEANALTSAPIGERAPRE